MEPVRRLNSLLERVVLGISVLLLAAFVAVVFLQVIARNYLQLPVLWATEVSLLTFLWSVFLGTAVAVRRKVHYVADLIPARFVHLNASLDVFADLAVLAFSLIMILHGYRFSVLGLTRYTTALAMRRVWFFAAIPASGVLSFWFGLEVLSRDLRLLVRKRTSRKEQEERPAPGESS